MEESNEDKLSVQLSSGRILHLRRIARRHVDRILGKYKLPSPPTYTFTGAGGTQVTKDHDETTLDTPEEREAWNKYLKDKHDIIAAQQKEVVEFLTYSCIVDEPPPPEQWSVDWALWGLAPPDPSDRIHYKSEWLESEVCITPDDYATVVARLYELGGLVGPDRAAEFEAFFRSAVARIASSTKGRRDTA